MRHMKLVGALLATALVLGGCLDTQKNDSKKIAKEGLTAYAQHQYDTAIEKYKEAVVKWPENHSAWYMLGGAYKNKKDWANAADAMAHAVEIAPEQAMYNMVYGYMLYEKAVNAARTEQASKIEGARPENIVPDLSGVNFDKALDHLQTAVKENDELWRAHYYIGRIYRDTQKPKEAAEEFTKALQFGPVEVAPWIALNELYRSWDYTNESQQVAEQGVAVVPEGSENLSDLYYVLGMSYTDKRLDDKAIEALTKALEISRDNHKARFQRGQIYYTKGDTANALTDLMAFQKSGGGSLDALKEQANKMVAEIQSKQAPAPEKLSPEDAVKQGKHG